MTPPDSELIIRTVVSGDRDAFGGLVQRYQSSVRRFLRHLTRGNTAWADDLTQETFLRAYLGLAHFRSESSLSTWLLGIAHNQFCNEYRKQRQSSALPDETAPDVSIPSGVSSADLKHDLALAMLHVSPDEQTVLHLCYQQGLSHGEAAAILDCPIGTVKTHLARGKEKLRQHLSAWNPQT